jgi:murein DD-endopeptidase MepM/ murein hydrolase activator NlpD
MKNTTPQRLFKKWIFIGFFSLISQLAQAQDPVQILPQTNIQVSSNELDQGDVVLMTITTAKDVRPSLTWRNKEIPLAVNPEKTKWFGFLEASLEAHPGKNRALVKLSADGQVKTSEVEITIKPKDYGVRDLTLPKEMVDLDGPTLERVQKENKVLAVVWSQALLQQLWQGPFIRPVSGEEVGPFGRKSIINHLPRAPHTGVDLRGEKGTPIKAANDGRVVLIADHFFTGHTVIIDHGGYIQSMYFHMDQVGVETGQMVAKGDVIGQVGETGRVTGPHLHFGIRVNGTAVDPLHFIQISEQITEL